MQLSKGAADLAEIFRKRESVSGRSIPSGSAATPQPKQLELEWADELCPPQPHPDPEEGIGS